MLSERELESRFEVSLEQYATKINIEAETAASIARTMLLPAALQYLDLLDEAGDGAGVERLTEEASGSSTSSSTRSSSSRRPTSTTEDSEILDDAKYIQNTVLPAMAAVREVADRLERVVPDESWPLPKYSEILFIK